MAEKTSQPPASLFAAYSNTQNDAVAAVKGIEQPPMQWLSNTSFSSSIAELKKPVVYEQSLKHRTEDDSVSTSEIKESSSRELSPIVAASERVSESSSSPERHRDKHEKQKKKHKKKHKHRTEDEDVERRHREHRSKHEDDDDHDRQRRHRHRSRDRDPDKKHREHKHKQMKKAHPEKKQRAPSPVRPPPNRVFLEDVLPIHADPFRVDRKPDLSNWSYKCIYKMHIAQYKRIRDACIGTKNGKVVFVDPKHPAKHKSNARYFSKEQRKHMHSGCVYIAPSSSKSGKRGFSEKAEPSSWTFIPIDSVAKPVDTNVNPLGVYDAATALFLQGKAPQPSVCDSPPVETHEANIRSQTTQYNARLHAEPHNIDLWMEFVKFQEESSEFLQLERSKEEHDRKRKADRSLQEIQAAILDKALEKNPGCVRLKIAQLELAERQFADTGDLKERWKNTVFTHSNHPVLWARYLEFVRGRVISSTVSGTIKAYAKCLEKLHSVHSGDLKSHPPYPNTKHYMLEFFLELCHIIQQSDHSEKAIASLQAMTELNLFCPNVLAQASCTDKLEFLETYWESGARRVGQQEAVGWDTWLNNKGEGMVLGSTADMELEEATEEAIVQSGNDKPSTWKLLEQSRMARHWIPWQPDMEAGQADDDCEDPERLVLFDDISPCLFCVDTDFQRLRLLFGFLEVLGVQTVPLFPSSNAVYQRQRHFTLTAEKTSVSVPNIPEKYDGREVFVGNVFLQCQRCFTSSYASLIKVMYIQYLSALFVSKSETMDKKTKKAEGKLVKKQIKQMLAAEENRNNLILWDAYAKCEAQLGNYEDSRKVLQTAIAMSERNDSSVLMLYVSYCKQELMNDNREACLHGLVCMALSLALNQSHTVSAIQILKARHAFQDLLEKELDAKLEISEDGLVMFACQQTLLVHVCQAFAYFQYLTVDVNAASVIFQQTLDKIKPEATAQLYDDMQEPGKCYESELNLQQLQYEKLYEAYVEVLRLHVTSCKSPLNVLRIPLQTALDNCPWNPRLLQILVEMGGGSWHSRHRGYFQSREMSSETWLWAITAELHRADKLLRATGETVSVKQLGIHHQVRAWLEKAVNHPKGRRVLLLWRLYFHFELHFENIVGARAVYYRAVQQCPWAKCLYMDYVGAVPADLQAVTDLMTEKEVRVRTPLEELDILMPNIPQEEVMEGDPESKEDTDPESKEDTQQDSTIENNM